MEKRGYALKVERGERPFIYSDELRSWELAVKRRDERAQDETARAWSRRHRMFPRHKDETPAEAERRFNRQAA